MCKFSSKSGGGVPFQPLGNLTWNDPPCVSSTRGSEAELRSVSNHVTGL